MSPDFNPRSRDIRSCKTPQTFCHQTRFSETTAMTTMEDDNSLGSNKSFYMANISTSNKEENKTCYSSDSISSDKDSKREKQLNDDIFRNQEHMKLARKAVQQYTLLKNINKEKHNSNSTKMNHHVLPRRGNDGRAYQDPTYFDVLCGRSKRAFDHPGNHIFRAKIAKRMDEYTKCGTRSGKSTIILSVISSVTDNGGNFLKYDSEKEMWYDGGTSTARIRVSTAFRDVSIPNKNKCMDQLRKKSFSYWKDHNNPHPYLIRDE